MSDNIVTCRTEGCPSSGEPVVAPMSYIDADTGTEVPYDQVVCGACSQPITDVRAVDAEDEDTR